VAGAAGFEHLHFRIGIRQDSQPTGQSVSNAYEIGSRSKCHEMAAFRSQGSGLRLRKLVTARGAVSCSEPSQSGTHYSDEGGNCELVEIAECDI
jgi:hypothetical protein